MATTVIEPGFIQPPSIEPPFLRQPNGSVLFGERSRRLMALADGHIMADFLRFMGHLAEAQQRTLDRQAAPVLPDAGQISLCKVHGMPPLGTQTLQRDSSWREGLSTILEAGQANAATQAAIARIQVLSETELEVFADRLLKGIAYFNIEGGDDAVKAEACDECNSYLKILYLEKNMALDPIADDLASLALDILMDEAGYQRSGPNLLLFPAAQDA